MLESKSDRLVIGYDCSDEDDTYLMVMREEKDGLHMVNQFKDDCAVDLYNILVGIIKEGN